MTSTFLSALIRDYLADAGSLAAGVPDNTVLKKQALTDTKLAKPPRLLVAVDTDPEKKHEQKIVFVCAVVITVESGINARATTEGWLKKIRERITAERADLEEGETSWPGEAFAAWIDANRTEEQRAGWKIVRLRLFASEEDFAVEDETKTYSLSLPLRLTVHLV